MEGSYWILLKQIIVKVNLLIGFLAKLLTVLIRALWVLKFEQYDRYDFLLSLHHYSQPMKN